METHSPKQAVAFALKLLSPKAMNNIMLMAGILAHPNVDVFPFTLRLTVTFISTKPFTGPDLQLRDSSGFTPDSLLILFGNKPKRNRKHRKCRIRYGKMKMCLYLPYEVSLRPVFNPYHPIC
jgi:hypothetical protein